MLVRAHVEGRPLRSRELAARVKEGLPIAELDELRMLLGLTMESLASRVGVSIATLSRRRRRGSRLDSTHSDRVLRFARLFRLATELHEGDEEAARLWLRKPARVLDGETPLDHAETEIGAREVENLIGRLEHSVYT